MTEPYYFNPGDHYVLEDISGFKRRYSKCRKIPGGQTGQMIVDAKRWEPQQPQDFVRGVVDEIAVPGPEARPRQANEFVVTGTWVTEFAPVRSETIRVASTLGFSVGDRIMVMLDIGENYFPIVVAIGGNEMRLTPVLPASVGGPTSSRGMIGNYGDPLENMVIRLGPDRGVAFLVDDKPPQPPIVDDYGDLFQVRR